jgi:hypothetical protein
MTTTTPALIAKIKALPNTTVQDNSTPNGLGAIAKATGGAL